jgi:hypothetical protein
MMTPATITEDDRKLQPMAQDGRDARNEHDNREVLKQFNTVHCDNVAGG